MGGESYGCWGQTTIMIMSNLFHLSTTMSWLIKKNRNVWFWIFECYLDFWLIFEINSCRCQKILENIQNKQLHSEIMKMRKMKMNLLWTLYHAGTKNSHYSSSNVTGIGINCGPIAVPVCSLRILIITIQTSDSISVDFNAQCFELFLLAKRWRRRCWIIWADNQIYDVVVWIWVDVWT